jgi:hypothetical protein
MLRKIETIEKLGGVVTIVAAITGLYLISVFRPPTFIQIICALIGASCCLVGVVFLFAEGSIMEERLDRKVPKVK